MATSAEGPVSFADIPLRSGKALRHQSGTTVVTLDKPGVYFASFHGAAQAGSDTALPAALRVQLRLNGSPVTGAVAQHSFTAAGQAATLSFGVSFRVSAVPAKLEVCANRNGFSFGERSLTVHRLGA